MPVAVQGLIPKSSLNSSKGKLARDATSQNLIDTQSPKLVINMKSIDNERDSLQRQTHEREDPTITHGRRLESQQDNSATNATNKQNAAVILSRNSLTKVK